MKAKITILGSGTSTGIPITGCMCEVCQSQDTKDKRLRSSILITTQENKNILIDTTPDLRQQCLRENIHDIHAAIVTHDHADHIHGIDDLRPYCFIHKKTIPIFTSNECAQLLKIRFDYIFGDNPSTPIGGGVPKLDLKIISCNQPQNICDLEFNFFMLPHGRSQTLGFSQGKMAYLIDCHTIPQDVVNHLNSLDLDVLILDCTGAKKHQTHLTLERSLHYAKEIKSRYTGLTHIGHSLSHETFNKELLNNFGPHIQALYDEQILEYDARKTP